MGNANGKGLISGSGHKWELSWGKLPSIAITHALHSQESTLGPLPWANWTTFYFAPRCRYTKWQKTKVTSKPLSDTQEMRYFNFSPDQASTLCHIAWPTETVPPVINSRFKSLSKVISFRSVGLTTQCIASHKPSTQIPPAGIDARRNRTGNTNRKLPEGRTYHVFH